MRGPGLIKKLLFQRQRHFFKLKFWVYALQRLYNVYFNANHYKYIENVNFFLLL